MTNEFNVSPDFSVFSLVQRSREHRFAVNHRLTMSLLSHEIEQASGVYAGNTIFAGFQRYSRFVPQVERYRRLAARSRQIYVFGEPDIELPTIENIVYVPLRPDDRLVREWFLVSYGQKYFSALATEEMTRIDDADKTRQFRGIWTFDLDLVAILYTWLVQTVGERAGLVDSDTDAFQQDTTLIAGTLMSLTRKLVKEWNPTLPEHIQQELQAMIDTTVNPALENLS